MDRAEIVAALSALGAALDSRGLRGEMYVVGGAAIALAYDARRSTRDIDAVFEPKAAIYEAAAEVSQALELPPGWLNDVVKGFLAGEDPHAAPVLDVPGPRRQARFHHCSRGASGGRAGLRRSPRSRGAILCRGAVRRRAARAPVAQIEL